MDIPIIALIAKYGVMVNVNVKGEWQMPVDDIEKCSDFFNREFNRLPCPRTTPEWQYLARDSIEAVTKQLERLDKGEQFMEKVKTALEMNHIECALAKWMQQIYNQGRHDCGVDLTKKAKDFIMGTLF